MAATTRRRKIFPHLNEGEDGSSKSKAAKEESASSTKKDEYDNNKSKSTKVHPSAKSKTNGSTTTTSTNKPSSTQAAAGSSIHHLIPLPLVLTVLICSGFYWIVCFRDVMATGKPILDYDNRLSSIIWGEDVNADMNYLQYTKSTEWYDDSKGWKSKAGGLSTILAVTTDANNMGGLFVRKMVGIAGIAYHTTKLLPIVFQTAPSYVNTSKVIGSRGKWSGNSWSSGHYDPILILGVIGNVCLATFYLNRLDDLKNANAGGLAMLFIMSSLIEAFIFGMYLIQRRMSYKAKKMTERVIRRGEEGYDPNEDPNALPSRIVARTVLIVSSLISVVSLRDALFPGMILPFIPRDDIYLEWTGAFLHSHPPDTIEADEHGLESPLFAGDKFVSQLLGLYLALGCMYKLFSAWGWSKGNRRMHGGIDNVDRGGLVSSKMIWKAQALGDVLLLGMLRLFTPAAKSASLDLRWHLMLIAYEAFILFLYAFF